MKPEVSETSLLTNGGKSAPFGKWQFISNPSLLALYVLTSTPAAVFAGMIGGRLLLPFVQAAVIFPVFVVLVTRGQWARAIFTMVFWAAWTGLFVICLSLWLNDFVEPRVILADDYRHEMFTWISTGAGPEGDIRQFLPQHLFHAILFSSLTAISGGFLGLAMGAVLMNYMSFYVGSLLIHSFETSTVAPLVWPVWAAIRVIAFITIATALSALFWDQIGRTTAEPRRVLRYLLTGAALLLLDVILKWQLAGYWQKWLQSLTDLG